MVRSQEVNWEKYFQHIKPVCPWSGAALKKGELKITQWSGEIEPLGNNQAIVYICPNYNRRRLKKLHKNGIRNRSQLGIMHKHEKSIKR